MRLIARICVNLKWPSPVRRDMQLSTDYHRWPPLTVLVRSDLATSQKINKLPAAAPFAIMVSFSHDGHMVAIGYLNSEVRLWDYLSERLIAEFTDSTAASGRWRSVRMTRGWSPVGSMELSFSTTCTRGAPSVP